jgi:hypothetical protein
MIMGVRRRFRSRSLPVDKFGESLDRTRVLVLPVTVADRERLGGVTTVG